MKSLQSQSAIPLATVALILFSFEVKACEEGNKKSMKVSVSAYNSVAKQTQGHPAKTAWGDTLKPGMKAIAVSRDLIAKGLKHKTAVRIEGLQGDYLVLDKMAKRWKNRVDVYMGTDVNAAREWGKKKRTITWCAK